MWLFLLFVVLPAVELYLLVVLGKHMGVLATVGLILVTGMLGSMLVRAQGMVTLRRIRAEIAQGRLPAEEMVAGLCLLGSGLLLVTPGVLTDAVGFLVLIPPLRRALARQLMSRFKLKIMPNGPFSGTGDPGDPRGGSAPDGEPRVDLGDGEIIDIPAENVTTYVPEEHDIDDHDGRRRTN